MRKILPYIYCSILLFTVGFAVGGYHGRTLSQKDIDDLARGNLQSMSLLIPTQKFPLFIRILKTNMGVIFCNFSGALCFALPAIVTTLYNGYSTGFFYSSASTVYGTGFVIRHTLPHSGEILGILISCAIGLLGAADLMRYFIKSTLPVNLKVYYIPISVAISITALSAAIEAFLSTLKY
jgi:uncharacterized membrane protein SpoIIM required for sporulation